MDLAGQFQALAVRAAAEPGIRYRALARDFTVAFVAGSLTAVLANRGGTFDVRIAAGPAPADITLTATDAVWAALFAADRRPGLQTLQAAAMSGQVRIDGDRMLYNQYIFTLELICGTLPQGAPAPVAPFAPSIDPVQGRYLNLWHAGQHLSLYFEEAGHGIPLLCLHTAGADGRQYRAILRDPAITARFRVIAFDLPRHGKSALAPGYGGDQWRLTTDGYVAIVMAVIEALGLERPVVMGCSIGGRAVLHLAQRHGAALRAAIGLQSALHADGAGIDYTGGTVNNLFRPDINGGELAAASVAAIMSPASPPQQRWETLWYYMQGGPGVFLGDLFYYFEDGDLRNRIGAGIDTRTCPLYLLTGEYDLSATPEMTRELAEAVGATHFEVMPGLGHFPMSEDPARFRGHLLPVLERIATGQDVG